MTNRSDVQHPTLREANQTSSPGWVATLAHARPEDLQFCFGPLGESNARSRSLYLSNESGAALPLVAERSNCYAIFSGVLFNRSALAAELGDFLEATCRDDAEIILAGYLRWGQDLLHRLRGTFALTIWDSTNEIMLVVRDPLGNHPLFYAQGRRDLHVSPSLSALLSRTDVPSDLNRAALADHLVDRYPSLDETFYAAINRLPPGHALRVTRDARRTFRYWDPAPPDREVNWLTPDEVERFDELFDQAVSRCLSVGPTGIFLSGGLDSVSVAAVATERSQAEGLTRPWALSLIFPNPKENEEIVQRKVASQLGLPQVLKPFFEATQENGLLYPALELSKSLNAPLLNTWLPAYSALALEGRRRGCQTIITGNGGDEWLTISPYLAADLLRELDFRNTYRLYRSMRRSFKRSRLAWMRNVYWTLGTKPLIMTPAHQFVKSFAPWLLKFRHQISLRPAPWIIPPWLSPDPELRRELKQRREAEHERRKQGTSSYYIREVRTALEHPIVSWEFEEMFEVYQRLGVRMLQPFCDADLVDFLYRTPPMSLIYDGRNKGLVRRSLSRRFPELGFDRHRKMEATSFYSSLIYQDGGKIWQNLNGARTLGSLGIIDEKVLQPTLDGLLASRREGRNAHRAWTILNVESWARNHVS